MKVINEECFDNCTGLKEIVCKATVPPTVETNAFYKTYSKCVITVPKGSKELYEKAEGWKNFTFDEMDWSVKVNKIDLGDSIISLKIGEVYSPTVQVYPEDADDKSITWSVDDSSIIFLNTTNGSFVGLKQGTATVTATANDGSGCTASIIVKVKSSLGKCEKPTIAYSDGVVKFDCNNEGAQIHYTIKANDDVKTPTIAKDNIYELSKSYDITAYATKDGYDDSDITEATLIWTTAAINADGINEVNLLSAASTPLIITQNDGMITIEGLNNNDIVTCFNINGTEIAKNSSHGLSTKIDLTELRNQIAIISVNGKTAKILVK